MSSHPNNSRPFEQNNVGATQVVNNYFQGTTYFTTGQKKRQGVMLAMAILMFAAIPFTTAYPPFSIVLGTSGLLILPGTGRVIARTLGIRVTSLMRRISLVLLLLLNLSFGIVFGRVKSQLEETKRIELLHYQQARRVDQQRRDSLDISLQQVADFQDAGEIDKALMELDNADQLAKTAGEKADVNQIRIEISLVKATKLTKKHQYNMAIDLLTSVHKLDTNNIDILWQRAGCYVKTNHIPDAVHDAKRAMLQGHKGAGDLYEKLNPPMKRIAYYRTLCKDGTYSNASGRGACSYHGGIKSKNHPVYEIYRQYE